MSTRRNMIIIGGLAGLGIGVAATMDLGGPVERAALAAPEASAAGVPVDLYLRRWQGIPPDVKIEVGASRTSPVSGLEAVTITLTRAGRSQRVDVFRGANGRYLVPGPLLDLTEDPHAELAARIDFADRASLGRPDAPVTIVEYSSFQCPYCRQLATVVKETLRGRLGKDVRWVYKHFPLSTQAWSELAAVGAECARQLGGNATFWVLHDLYFEEQPSFTPQNHRGRAVAWAKRAGLSVPRFESCLDGGAALGRVRADADEGRVLGVSSTPTLVINGRIAPGAVSKEVLEGILEQELTYQQALTKVRGGSPGRAPR